MASRRKYLTEDEILISVEDLPSDIDTPVESSSDEELERGNSNVAGSSESQNVQLSDTDSSEDEELSECQKNWKKTTIFNSLPVFSKEVDTILQHFVGKETATDIFLTVLSECTIDNLVFQTNLYIQQQQQRVKPVDTAEMHSFSSSVLVRLPHMRPYWSSDMHIAVPIVPKAMTRDRYFEILANLHVNDNSAIPENNSDTLFKTSTQNVHCVMYFCAVMHKK